MASLVLTAAGYALAGGAKAGIWGSVAALAGGIVGSRIDQALSSPVRSEGPRLSDLAVQASTYGEVIPRVFGPENRISGNVIWSTGLVETKSTESSGGKGGGSRSETTSYTYHVDCQIALCRGPIVRIGRIWADGKLFMDADGVQQQANAIRVYLGTDDQLPDPLLEAAIGAGETPANRGLAYVVFDHLELEDFGNRIPLFTFEVVAHESATVATVIDELCTAANVPYLDAARTEFLDLRGYVLSRSSTVRESLEPLRSAFFFDVSEVEGELQVFPADSNPVARVGFWELGAHPQGSERPAPYQASRTASAELPRQVNVVFHDPARDYQENSMPARRATVSSTADLTVELPLVLTASEAKSIAEQLLSSAWLRRLTGSTQLPISFLHVEPGMKVVVPFADGIDRTLRVERKEARVPAYSVIEFESDGALALSRQASSAGAPVRAQEVRLPGPTTAWLLDLPILRDQDDYSGFYAAGNGPLPGWRGAVLYRSLDAGANYSPLQELAVGATIGATLDAPEGVLAAASPHFWDEGSNVTVTLTDPADTLEGRSAAEVLNGANACAIGGAAGWEVLQFREAELIAPGPGAGATYRLSGLLRGRKGTEAAIAGHGPNEAFVLLSGAPGNVAGVYRPDIAASETGLTRAYKAASSGTLLSDAPVIDFTLEGRWARPYPVAHVGGSRDGAGDLAIAWIRRTRLEAPWQDGVDAPLGEASEAYELEVLAGPSGGGAGTVLRTVSATAPALVYTAAQQVADFGSAQAQVTVRIYQLSARVGRGLPKEATL